MEDREALIIAGGYIYTDRFLSGKVNIDTIKFTFSNAQRQYSVNKTVSDDVFVIAADSGCDNAELLGVKPDIIVGDMDSAVNVPENVELIKHPPEKDLTDTMLAIDIAVSRKFREITIIGGMAGRADHTLSTMFCLEYLYEKGISARVCDGLNVVQIVGEGSYTFFPFGYKYISILSLDDSIVSFTGVKYPLEDALIKRSVPYAVSNEITDASCTLTVKSGRLFLICSD